MAVRRVARPAGTVAIRTGRSASSRVRVLLGVYLGDGHLARHARGVYRLRVVLDSRYPLIVHEVAEAMEALFPGKDRSARAAPKARARRGPGKKHERLVVLTDWQRELPAGHHREFVRGLIHSDGCRHINRVWRNGKAYEYSLGPKR